MGYLINDAQVFSNVPFIIRKLLQVNIVNNLRDMAGGTNNVINNNGIAIKSK